MAGKENVDPDVEDFNPTEDEEVIGHRSLEALHSYERIYVSQNQEVSKILMTNMPSESVA